MKFIKIIDNFISNDMRLDFIDIIDFSIENNFCNKRDSDTVKDNQVELGVGSNNIYPISATKNTSRLLFMLNVEFENYLEDYRCEDSWLPISTLRSFNVFGQKSNVDTNDGYYKYHCETTSLETTHRALAWILYLNDVPDGEGETEFAHQNMKISPTKGRLVIFPSGFTHTHRGNPVKTENKYILTGWAYHTPTYNIE